VLLAVALLSLVEDAVPTAAILETRDVRLRLFAYLVAAAAKKPAVPPSRTRRAAVSFFAFGLISFILMSSNLISLISSRQISSH
jgi:hypothetical protein